jgi:hypothetical protein
MTAFVVRVQASLQSEKQGSAMFPFYLAASNATKGQVEIPDKDTLNEFERNV